jgi:16S rRNA (cytosine967-C5)-methyltransferase
LMKNSLAIAIEALSWMAYGGISDRSALFKAAEELDVRKGDELRQGYRLIMETTRFQNRLEYMISQIVSAEEFDRAPHGIKSLLKILTYLKYVDVMRETSLSHDVSSARQILGWKELQPYEQHIALIVAGRAAMNISTLPEFERLSLETCHPVWFVQRLVSIFGRSVASKILHRDLRPLPAYARVNSLKTRGQSTIGVDLSGSGVGGIAGVFRIGRKGEQTRFLESGEVVIQDLASIIAGLVASPKPGDIVLDVCAAPGNKTTHLAAMMQNQGQIYSVDISGRRLSRWKKETVRCGCEIADPVQSDARRMPFRTAANLVLVDPPCSNTGVFARSPAGKWNITPNRVNEFALRQYSILQSASDYVMPGGTLVYCTCSILPEENEVVIEEFLRRGTDFKMVEQSPFLGSAGLRGLNLCQRFYPHVNECNGYFIAKMQRLR